MIPPTFNTNLLGLWLLSSPWMLFWALTAIVPVLIHLWSRRRYEEVPWAAMRFLLIAIRKNARRWRIEQLLLLATRMMILILLAIALADPILALLGDGTTSRGRGGDTHHVLVIDTSYSMDYQHTDSTRFDIAKRLASEFVRECMQGDGFTLIKLADPPQVVVRDPVFDRESMVTEIAQLNRTDGGADLPATLVGIERVLDQASAHTARLQRHQISFFTDLGRNTWSEVTSEAAATALARLADRAQINLYDVGQRGGQNVAVTRLRANTGVATVGAAVRLEIELENFGNQDRSDLALNVLVDGQQVGQLTANIAGGERANLALVHRFQVPGEHVVEVRLEEDRLEADNHRWLCLHVHDAFNVLCVEGKAGAARNIALALEPNMGVGSSVRPVVRSEIALLEERLSQYEAIFLCNVGRFGSVEAALLRAFLQRGGGVVIFLGDQVQAANYNAVLGPDAGENRCFSVRLGEPTELGEYLFDPLEYQHPIVEPFRGHARAGLLTTPVWKYVRATADAESRVNTAIAFLNGDPAVLEERLGNGRVLMATTDASSVSVDRSTDPPTPWSALAAWPSFPPLVQQLLQVAVQDRNQLRNVIVGDALQGYLASGSEHTSVMVSNPESRDQRVPVKVEGELIQWAYTDTTLGGVYAVSEGNSLDDVRYYAANLDTRESLTERFDAELLPSFFRREEAAASPDGPEIAMARPVRFFRYVLAAVLVMLIVEASLAWYFGRATA
jgi:hypothetical protein